MNRISCIIIALLITPGGASAAGIHLCNNAETDIRSAVILKAGFNYITDTWDSTGWYIISPGDCVNVGGSGWGGSRAWGYVSIEHKYSAKDLEFYGKYAERRHVERETEKKRQALHSVTNKIAVAEANLSFYEHLLLYLPGSAVNSDLANLFAEYHTEKEKPLAPFTPGDGDKWRLKILERREAQIDEPGFTGSKYSTCLPRDGFRYSTTGRPSERTSCSQGQRLVPFTAEVWIMPGATLTLSVEESSINSNYRH